MTFQRARSDEQRELRRQAILQTAAAMLAELSVAEVSLNELARRVGLAKSNVLRYFESREEVLLELLDSELGLWLVELTGALPAGVPTTGSLTERIDATAALLATSLARRPVLCDLLSAQAAVLERNVSPAVASKYKRCTVATVQAFAGLIRTCLPELQDDAFLFAGATQMAVGGIWQLSQPSAAMLAAYEAEPDLAAMRMGFESTLTQLLAVLLAGVIARRS